jgi:hypothetical protein
MRTRMMAGCWLLSLCVLSAGAQMPMSHSKDSGLAAGAMADPAMAVDSQLSLVESQMMGLVKAMPAAKFGFAPNGAIFVTGQTTEFAKVRTFGEQGAHVAQANYFFYEAVSGLKSGVDMDAIGTLTKKEDVVAALESSFAFAHKAVATLTAANAFEVIKTPEPGLQTRATFATFGVAHAYDHYGQMVVYLRMNGLVPPASM